jgi:hypothetical protein
MRLMQALQTLFVKYPNVVAAYVAQIVDPEAGTPPHPVIGVLTDGTSQDVYRDAGIVIRDMIGPDETVDMIEMQGSPLGQYIQKAGQLFYQRR